MGVMDVWIDRSVLNRTGPILLEDLPEALQVKPVAPVKVAEPTTE